MVLMTISPIDQIQCHPCHCIFASMSISKHKICKEWKNLLLNIMLGYAFFINLQSCRLFPFILNSFLNTDLLTLKNFCAWNSLQISGKYFIQSVGIKRVYWYYQFNHGYYWNCCCSMCNDYYLCLQLYLSLKLGCLKIVHCYSKITTYFLIIEN